MNGDVKAKRQDCKDYARRVNMAGPRTFQLKAQNHWVIKDYKGKPRIVMNRDVCTMKQPITHYDVLSVAQVRALAAWLARYLNIVEPTEQTAIIAGARAHSRGSNRELEKLEVKSVYRADAQKN